MDCRIEVFSKIEDARAKVKLGAIHGMGEEKVKGVEVADVYTVSSPKLEKADFEKCGELLSNPVMQGYLAGKAFIPREFDFAIEIGFLPGVMDNVGNTAAETIRDFFGEKAKETVVYSSQLLFLKGKISAAEAKEIAVGFANPLIQRIHIKGNGEFQQGNGMDLVIPKVHLNQSPEADEVDLEVSDAELTEIGKKGIMDADGTRRGPLALDLESMKVIREYFRKLGRNPTDIELESLAQTWSEHCKHTIFAAELDEIKGGLFKDSIRKSTEEIRKKKGAKTFAFQYSLTTQAEFFLTKKILLQTRLRRTTARAH